MNRPFKSINKGLTAGLAVIGIALGAVGIAAPASAQTTKPNILVIWGDDIGWSNVSAYNMGIRASARIWTRHSPSFSNMLWRWKIRRF